MAQRAAARSAGEGDSADEIVARCRQGEREAFRLLYERYQSKVYSVAFQEDAYMRLPVASSVQRAIATLKPKLRLAILPRYFEELSYEEMARVLDCSVRTVACRLSREHQILAGETLAPTLRCRVEEPEWRCIGCVPTAT